MKRDDDLQAVLERLAAEPDRQDAWSDLYRILWPFIVATVVRLLKGKRAAVDDAAQEVFVRLLRVRPFLFIRDADAFRGYVWRMAKNVAISHLRASQSKHEVELSMVTQEYFDFALPESETEADKWYDQLDWAQRHLEVRDLELLDLLLQGKRLREIAESLNITYTSAEVRVHRLRTKIHNLLKNKQKIQSPTMMSTGT